MDSSKFVDDVYDELSTLFEKDKNQNKLTLGNNPILKIFEYYSDWLANNLSLSPKVAANAIYRDVMDIRYIDFNNRKLKRGVQLKGELGFNNIYGTQKEIDAASQILNKLKNENPNKYTLIMSALDKIKTIADTIKPVKNIFGGKTTNLAKHDVSAQNRMPRFTTLETLLKLNEKQLTDYIKKFDSAIK